MFPHLSASLACAVKGTMVLVMGKYYHNEYLRERRAKFEILLDGNPQVSIYH